MKYLDLISDLEKHGLYIEDIEGIPSIQVCNRKQAMIANKILIMYKKDSTVRVLYSKNVVYCVVCCDNYLKNFDDGIQTPYGYVCEKCLEDNGIS